MNVWDTILHSECFSTGNLQQFTPFSSCVNIDVQINREIHGDQCNKGRSSPAYLHASILITFIFDPPVSYQPLAEPPLYIIAPPARLHGTWTFHPVGAGTFRQLPSASVYTELDWANRLAREGRTMSIIHAQRFPVISYMAPNIRVSLSHHSSQRLSQNHRSLSFEIRFPREQPLSGHHYRVIDISIELIFPRARR